jgi:hypothetical protein
MPSSWTDTEYATVAEALLYPGGRVRTIVSGYVPAAYPLGWQLDARLQQLDDATKQRALVLAQQIRAGEEALLASALGGGSGGCGSNGAHGAITQVGDIKFDPRLGRSERESLLMRARGLLALLVDFQVNPNAAAQMSGAGGINGTCL